MDPLGLFSLACAPHTRALSGIVAVELESQNLGAVLESPTQSGRKTNMGLVFRDDGLVVKQAFSTQATQTHMRAHHDREP